LLADLRALRALQLRQRDAVAAADGELLDALHEERMAIQARIVPLERAGLTGADRAEAEALVDLLLADQDVLVEAAAAVRDGLGTEIRGMQPGRAALHGYRAAPAVASHYVDRVG
jgi:hypothetical protein